MRRRRRIRRWLAGWRRLLAFGRMLQDLHERGLQVAAFAESGSPLTVRPSHFTGVAPIEDSVVVSIDGQELGRWPGRQS